MGLALLITQMMPRVPRRGSFSFPFIPADCSKATPSPLCPSSLANPTMDLQISRGKALLATRGLAQKPRWCWHELPDLHLLLPHSLEAPWLSKCSGNPDNFSRQFHPPYDAQPCLPTRHSHYSFCRQDIKVLPKKTGELEEEKPSSSLESSSCFLQSLLPFPSALFSHFLQPLAFLCHFFSFCLSPASESQGAETQRAVTTAHRGDGGEDAAASGHKLGFLGSQPSIRLLPCPARARRSPRWRQRKVTPPRLFQPQVQFQVWIQPCASTSGLPPLNLWLMSSLSPRAHPFRVSLPSAAFQV